MVDQALQLLDAQSPLPPAFFKLCLWTAQYYQHSLGDTLSWALPVLLRQGEPAEARQERFWSISDGAQLVDEEQFGPILPIIRFSDPEDALARANSSQMGLAIP